MRASIQSRRIADRCAPHGRRVLGHSYMGSLVMEVNDVQESNGAIDRRTLLRVLTAGLSSASVGRLSRLGATAVGAAGAAQAEPDVFEIHVGDQALDDLHRRLSTVRWPGDTPAEAWSYGVDRAYLEELMAYWRDDYDWRVWSRPVATSCSCLPTDGCRLDELRPGFSRLTGNMTLIPGALHFHIGINGQGRRVP